MRRETGVKLDQLLLWGRGHGLNLVLEAKLLSVALFFFRGRWVEERKGPIEKKEAVGMT